MISPTLKSCKYIRAVRFRCCRKFLISQEFIYVCGSLPVALVDSLKKEKLNNFCILNAIFKLKRLKSFECYKEMGRKRHWCSFS